MKVKLTLALLFLLVSRTVFSAISIIYPAPEDFTDSRQQYFYKLLDSALLYSKDQFGPYQLSYMSHHIPGERVPMLVRENRQINILTSPTSIELESSMLAIKVPLIKGIQGLRIALIKSENTKFNTTSNLVDISSIYFGQGSGWIDTLIFKDAGYKVVTASRYSSLFKMLMSDRFDAFPRGVNEVYKEHAVWNTHFPSLSVENNLVFYYHLPVYFFVSKTNKELFDRINYGLNIMINNGAFDELFNQYFGDDIRQADLENRKLIVLENRYLPEDSIKDNKKLFHPFIVDHVFELNRSKN